MSNDLFKKYKEDKAVFEDPKSVKECFDYFDKDGDGLLNQHELEDVLKSLYSFNGTSYYISSAKLQKFYKYYDKNKNNRIDFEEFKEFWKNTVKRSLFFRSALIVVDVQNDFIDGTLALNKCPAREEAIEVVPVINDLINHVPFDLIVYTMDWHPADHISFFDNLGLRKLSEKSPIKKNVEMYDTVIFETDRDVRDIEQKLWPRHCVQMTKGAEFDPKLTMVEDNERSLIIKKGTQSDVDSYSAFFDNCKLTKTLLDEELKARNITDLYICGLATDVCVAATAIDGFELNYRIVIIDDACKGVDVDDISTTKKELINTGAIIINSKQAYKMVLGEDRRPELGYVTIK